jgi:hypothetical protein
MIWAAEKLASRSLTWLRRVDAQRFETLNMEVQAVRCPGSKQLIVMVASLHFDETVRQAQLRQSLVKVLGHLESAHLIFSADIKVDRQARGWPRRGKGSGIMLSPMFDRMSQNGFDLFAALDADYIGECL